MQYLSDRRWTLSAYVDVPLATAQQGAAEELRRCEVALELSEMQVSSIGKQDFSYSSLIDKKKMLGPHTTLEEMIKRFLVVGGSGLHYWDWLRSDEL